MSGKDLKTNSKGEYSKIPINSRVAPWLLRQALRTLMGLYIALIKTLKFCRTNKDYIKKEKYDILLTGNFYSKNWIESHLKPMARSRMTNRIIMVAQSPLPPIDKVTGIYAKPSLVSIFGGDIARLLAFLWAGIRTRPDVIGGFHLLFNGLAAGLLAQLVGSRSLYICGGGPREVIGGGYFTENRLFGKLSGPDVLLERLLLKAVGCFDLVVTRGTRAVEFFRGRGVESKINVVPGGIDGKRFYPSESPTIADLIFVARLSEVKRADLFLRAIKVVKSDLPEVKAIVVGNGPLLQFHMELAKDLGIEHNVEFVGHQLNVEHWLRKAKIFALTSESEGRSLAMMEAMLCGLPVVVSNVGDLAEMVEHGVNGYLVSDFTPEAFASYFKKLLMHPERISKFGEAARRSAERCEIANVSRLWDKVL